MKLRWYQDKAMTLMRQAFADGHRKIMLWLATGGGKSILFITVISNFLKNNKKVILVMRRRQLVLQAHEHFKKHGADSSVIMGNDKRFDKTKHLQICSIDTIARRDISFMVDFDAVVVDESHDATSQTYKDFFAKLNTKIFIGFTASPFQVGKKTHDFWDCCVKPIEVAQLRDEGFLVDAQIFVAHEVDTSGIKTIAGDYQNKQLGEVMSELKIIGDVVDDYKEFGQGKTAICFAVNKNHGYTLKSAFLEEGIEAVFCDESTKQKERDGAIAKLREYSKNKIPFILINVNIFSTGVDIPEAEVCILARPTKSEILYIQQVGRILRPYRRCGRCKKGYDNSPACYHCGYDKSEYVKEHAIIIDNGGNILQHGSPFKARTAVLKEEDKKKKQDQEQEEFKEKTCAGCFRSYIANLKSCPYCDYRNEKVQREIKRADGKTVPYDEFAFMQRKLFELMHIRDAKSLGKSFPYFQLYRQFGDDVYQYPELKVPSWIKKYSTKNNENKNIYS